MTTTWVVGQGTKGHNAEEMIETGSMGVDFIGDYDIAPHLGRGADAFRSAMTSVFLEMKPEKNKVAAGLAVGNLWWAREGIVEGDVVLAPKPDLRIRHRQRRLRVPPRQRVTPPGTVRSAETP